MYYLSKHVTFFVIDRPIFVDQSKNPPHYLSIVLSGGIALGSYHAGCVAQLGWFLSAWQEKCNNNPELPRIYVDVVSGASAGAMTGAMLFQYVGTNYFENTDGKEGFVKRNYDAWCRQLSLDKMLDEARTADDTSVLSNDVIERISHLAIQPLTPKLPKCQDRLFLTCTLTSLKPLSFAIKLPDATLAAEKVEISAQTRRDWITYQITSPTNVPPRMQHGNNLTYRGEVVFMELASSAQTSDPPLTELWDRVRYFAMSSGAFPFAWSPIKISRNLRFYPAKYRGDAPESASGKFEYMDGGVINNMPLDRAAKVIRDYALWTDAQAGITSRTYILIDVSPEGKPPSADLVTEPVPPLRESRRNITDEAIPLYASVREQSYYQDLLQAQKINEQLTHREEHLWPTMRSRVKNLDADTIQKEIGSANDSLHKLISDRYRTSDVDESDYLINMLAAQYVGRHPEQFDELDEAQRQLLARTMTIYDLIADLSGKHHMSVLQIRPKVTLKGAFFGDFGGFADHTFMRDDFWHGMQTTKCQLTKLIQALSSTTNTDDLFCEFSSFESLASEGSLPKARMESYYRKAVDKPTKWTDADPKSRQKITDAIQSRILKLGGNQIQQVWLVFRYLISPSAMLVCVLTFVVALFTYVTQIAFAVPIICGFISAGIVQSILIGVCRLISAKLQNEIDKYTSG